MTTMATYLRTRIHGTLTCQSDLHVGDGGSQMLEQRINRAPSEAKGFYQSICIGAQGPYIPASTLRGFLRDVARSTLPDQLVKKFFGYADENQTSSSGRLRFFDAPLSEAAKFVALSKAESKTNITWGQEPVLWSDKRSSSIRFGVALDPITQTAANNKLYRYEYIPRGTVFNVEVETEALTEAELTQVLTLLSYWDGSPASAIGKGISNGQGELCWKHLHTKQLNEDALFEWLCSPEDKSLGRFFKPIKDSSLTAMPDKPPAQVVKIEIKLDAPFLVHDPAYKPKKDKNKQKESEEENIPDHFFSRTPDGKALIPAKSMRGLIRARARRIVATIAYSHFNVSVQDAGTHADTLMQQLFGETGQRSPLRFSDFIASEVAAPHTQMFNAIDRFTGGVAHQRLYQALAAEPTSLCGIVSLDPRYSIQEDWWKGLLLLILRDALDGELAIGWGKAKGFGAFRASVSLSDNVAITSWEMLLDHLKTQQLLPEAERWIAALHDKIESYINKRSQPKEKAHV